MVKNMSWAQKYLQDVIIYFQLDKTSVEQIEIIQILDLISVEIDRDIKIRTSTEEALLVIYAFGCQLFGCKNRSIYLKDGISNWSVGRIPLQYDQTSMKSLGEDYCKKYQDTAKLINSSKNIGNRGKTLITNAGNGLWQSSQQRSIYNSRR
jgi:hypothetical protein